MYVEASAAPSGGREERAELRGERRLNPSSTYFQMLPELKIVLGYELEPCLQQLVLDTDRANDDMHRCCTIVD